VIVTEHIDGSNVGTLGKNVEAAKKYVKNLALFSEPKNVVLNYHVHHAFHHDLTIKKPRFARSFSQKPLQKRHSATTKKIRS
jgi:hypothetical protein